MALIDHDVWKGHDNTFKLRLESSGPDTPMSPTDLVQVTSMQLELIDTANNVITLSVVKDAIDPEMDWWNVARDIEQGEVLFDLGQWTLDQDVPALTYLARLTVFSPSTSKGLVWLSWADADLSIRVLE